MNIQIRLTAFLAVQKKTLAGAAIFALLLGSFPRTAEASTWSPTLLVNTESFQVIDEGDASTDIELRFGDAVDERFLWDRTNSRFRLTDDLFVEGALSGFSLRISGPADIHGALSASGAIRTDDNITINDDQTAADSTLTFGKSGGTETLTFSNANQQFEFSDVLRATGNIITEGTLSGTVLRVSGPADIHGTLTASGNVVTDGDLVLNDDDTVGNIQITFRDADQDETLIWENTAQQFEFSDDLIVRGTISGSALRVDQNADIWGDLTVSGTTVINGAVTVNNTIDATGNITTDGILSGATLRVSGPAEVHGSLSVTGALTVESTISGASLVVTDLKSCDTIDTNAQGVLVCGSDGGGGGDWSGTGALQTAFDDRYVNQSGDTMTGTLTIDVPLSTGTGLTISGTVMEFRSDIASVAPHFYIEGSQTTATDADIRFRRSKDGAVVLVDDSLGGVDFWGYDGADWSEAAGIVSFAETPIVSGQVPGRLSFFTRDSANTFAARMILSSSGNLLIGNTTGTDTLTVSGSALFNSNGQGDMDFQVQGDTDANMIYGDASSDRVGIGRSTPETKLEVGGTISGHALRVSGPADIHGAVAVSGALTVRNTISGSTLVITALKGCDTIDTDVNGLLTCGTDATAAGGLDYTTAEAIFVNQGGDTMTGQLIINMPGGGTAASFSGAVVFNNGEFDNDVRFAGTSETNLFFLNAGTDRIGIGTADPDTKLSVIGTISGSALRVDGNADIWGNLTASGTLTVDGTTTLNTVTYTWPGAAATNSGDVLSVDPSSGQLSWISGTSGSGDSISLQAEYPGAVYFSSGSSFVGQLTASGSVGAGGTPENFYHWTTSKTTNQDYWISTRVRIPDNFSSWDAVAPIQFRYRGSGGTLDLHLRDTANADVVLTGASDLTNSSFTTATITGPESAGTYTVDGYITLLVKLTTSGSTLNDEFSDASFIELNWETKN